MEFSIHSVGEEMASASIPLSIQTAPMFVYSLIGSKPPLRSKMVVVLFCIGVNAAASMLYGQVLAYAIGGLAYYVVTVSGLWFLLPLVRRRIISQSALAALCILLFLMVPGFATQGRPWTVFMVLSTGVAFSFHSYCVEASSSKVAPSLRDCLFFVLVDPVLVYTERSSRVDRATCPSGFPRVLIGALGMTIAVAISAPLIESFVQVTGRSTFAAVVCLGGIGLVTECLKHTSLASVHIGLMRQLGYSTPERYDFPLLAVSPMDFWRRWNIYLGSWIKRYVFWPLALHLGRAYRVRTNSWTKGAALVVAFVSVGVYHSLYAYATGLEFSVKWVEWFFVQAVFITLWLGLLFRARHVGALARVPGRHAHAFAIISRVCFLVGLFFTVGYWS